MFELRVLNGMHQGAALPLVGEEWTIGSDDEGDLALHDPGIGALHCRLQREGDRWSLDAGDGAIVDEEGHPLTDLQPDRQFILGSVWLCLSPADAEWPTLPAVIPPTARQAGDQDEQGENARNDADTPPPAPPRRRLRMFNRTSAIVVGVLLGIVGSAWSLNRAPTPEAAVASANGAVEAAREKAPVVKPDDKRTPLASADDAERTLNKMLSDRLLTDVNVQQTPEGLKLSGNLKDETMQVYQRMLARFNERYRAPVALIDSVSVGRGGLPFVIVQIISGPQAHLVTADGRRMYVGDEIEGLRLSRIDDNTVLFDGQRRVEVSW